MALLLAGLTAPLRDHLPWRSVVTLRLRIDDVRVDWWVGPSSDFRVLEEVFTQQAYALPIPEPEVILDLGSHMGASLLYFRARYPKARIIGVEPDPRTLERLRRNAVQLGVEVIEAAVTAQDGDVVFYSAQQGWISTLHPNGDWVTSLHRSQGRPVTVHGRSLDTLFDDLDLKTVDLLKIDTEGSEYEVLSASRRLPDIATIVGEFHGDRRTRDAFVSLLREQFEVEIVSANQSEFTATRRATWVE